MDSKKQRLKEKLIALNNKIINAKPDFYDKDYIGYKEILLDKIIKEVFKSQDGVYKNKTDIDKSAELILAGSRYKPFEIANNLTFVLGITFILNNVKIIKKSMDKILKKIENPLVKKKEIKDIIKEMING